MRGRLGLGARAEIAGSSPVVRVIGDSATGMVDPLLPGPIWRASARPNPPAQVLPPPFFPFRPHLKFPKRCRPEGGCAMGSEQQSTAAAREVLAGSVARERKEVAARARAAKLRTMRGEKAATTATAAHGRKVATAAPLPRLEEQRFAAPSLASGRSSTGPTFGAPKIDRPRNLPGHPNVTWRHELLRQPLLNIVPDGQARTTISTMDSC